jgi:hypothetical protein
LGSLVLDGILQTFSQMGLKVIANSAAKDTAEDQIVT